MRRKRKLWVILGTVALLLVVGGFVGWQKRAYIYADLTTSENERLRNFGAKRYLALPQGSLSPAQRAEVYCHLLSLSDHQFYKTASRNLHNMGKKSVLAIPFLMKHLESRLLIVRHNANNSLYFLGKENDNFYSSLYVYVPKLTKLFIAEKEGYLKSVISKTMRINGKIHPELYSLLSNKAPRGRTLAIDILRSWDSVPKEAIKPLVHLLRKDPIKEIRGEIPPIFGKHKINTKEVITALGLARAKDPDEYVRSSADGILSHLVPDDEGWRGIFGPYELFEIAPEYCKTAVTSKKGKCLQCDASTPTSNHCLCKICAEEYKVCQHCMGRHP